MSYVCALNHDVNQLEQLVNQYHFLTKTQKRILGYLQFIAKNCHSVFPSIQKLLERAHCHKRTVYRALEALESMGWVTRIKRGYQSNIYCLLDAIKGIDFRKEAANKKATFSHTKCHLSVTVLHNTSSVDIHVQAKSPPAPISASPNVPKNLEEGETRKTWYEKLPHALKGPLMEKLFDYKNYGWIIDKLPEQGIYEIKKDYEWFAKQHKPTNPGGLFVSLSLKYLKKLHR